MKNTSRLIELYSTGKISLDGLFAELEFDDDLDKNQIIEYCNKNISTLNSFFYDAEILVFFTEYIIYGFILNYFVVRTIFYVVIFPFFLFTMYKRNGIILSGIIMNLIFKKKYYRLKKLNTLKTIVTLELEEISKS
ncbi:MAG: hypothetical protein QNJ60_09860 [Xenococcaceae cyanobacterium MO_188.B19]|nr:hypothetical protein [Xenococcaceae cyanobacterium MO_188.B19]